MTLTDVEELLAGFEFVGGLSLWKLEMLRETDPERSMVRGTVKMTVPSVRPPQEEVTILMPINIEIPAQRIADPAAEEQRVKKFVFDVVQRMVLHELKEGLRWRGESIHPPHDELGEFL